MGGESSEVCVLNIYGGDVNSVDKLVDCHDVGYLPANTAAVRHRMEVWAGEADTQHE